MYIAQCPCFVYAAPGMYLGVVAFKPSIVVVAAPLKYTIFVPARYIEKG